MERNKPKFLRREWHKKIRLGRGIKKKQVWRAAKGRHNKIRLHQRGYPQRPTIGWGLDNSTKYQIKGLIPVRVENVAELQKISKGQGVIVGHVGKKKRQEIIGKANEMKLTILNKYKGAKDATGK